jgi:hypothetical protein
MATYESKATDPTVSEKVKAALEATENATPHRTPPKPYGGATWLRSELNDLAAAPQLRTGSAMHEEDRAALISEFVEDTAASVPARFKSQIREAASRIVELVESGDRQAAQEAAREAAFQVGSELPASWSPPQEDPAALAAQIPRN